MSTNNTNLPTLYIPYDAERVADSPGWQFSIGVQSESSNRMYVVAQRKTTKGWGCSCRGWIRHRHCKHLAAMQLPANERPYEISNVEAR